MKVARWVERWAVKKAAYLVEHLAALRAASRVGPLVESWVAVKAGWKVEC